LGTPPYSFTRKCGL